MKKRKLVLFSGNGRMNCEHSKGKFEVKGEGIKDMFFTDFQEALNAYDSLETPSVIWDMTMIPELIEHKQFDG